MTASPFHSITFYPDTILPSQQDHAHPLTGPQALYQGIIDEAMQCLYGRSKVAGRRSKSGIKAAQYRLAEEALAWFFSEARTAFPVSFLYCCDHLSLDPKTLRRRAKHLFKQLEKPPVRPAPGPPEIRAYVDVRQNKLLRAAKKPSWLARVNLKWSGFHGKTVKYINLNCYEETQEEARAVCRAYIESGKWREFLQEEREAA